MRLFLLLALLVQDVPAAGLVAEYFNIGRETRDFPHFPASKRPFLKRVEADVNVAETRGEVRDCGLSDHVYVRWTGLLRAPADGTYGFHLKADDGAALRIGGALVVDNGGLHAMIEKSGRIELRKGDHPIRVEFFDNDDGAACILSWEPPGGAKELVPASAFFHR